jgi:LacI family transcriptional regulator
MNKANPKPSVAILVDTSSSWGRQLVTGIHDHALRRKGWRTIIEARGVNEHLRVPAGWHGNGVIARVFSPLMAAELQQLGLPVVNVSAIALPEARFPQVMHDTGAGAAMVVRYFKERGFSNFAYFSLTDLPYVAAQQNAFREAVASIAGASYSVHGIRSYLGAEPEWDFDRAGLIKWLRQLPKPVGLLTWNASCGRQIVHACDDAGLRIPDEVALVSGTDDDLLCALSHIPISAVDVASRRIGLLAAQVLDEMLHGKVPAPRTLVPPVGVISRRSTDFIPLEDAVVAGAMRYIRANAAHPLQVEDVAGHAGVSRRALERRFLAAVAHSPGAEIRRARGELARQLLAGSDLPMDEIASRSGFGSADYLGHVFRADFGCTPKQYRLGFR